jgi:ubiquinone/menaquinone biosynthesis C-methylase UbiE
VADGDHQRFVTNSQDPYAGVAVFMQGPPTPPATTDTSMNVPIIAPADQHRLASVSDIDIDYGIDAPGVRRGMFTAAGAGAILTIAGATLIHHSTGTTAVAAQIAYGLGLLATLYGTGMGAYMTFSSRIAKRRTRERLLDLAQTVSPWSGNERVLDVGCGRGLMMIGAARRLSTGTAVGMDLWRSEDQDGNSRDATEENARRAGVAARVRVETGDARALSFEDDTFDVVLSHWVVHNLPDAGDRARALDEMLRVLKHGGVLVIADIANMQEYRTHLIARGAVIAHVLDGGWEARILRVLSGGSYVPQAVVARRT